jgi:hypothetical protein
MNKANNRITFRLESDLDGSLGVEHAKVTTLSMTVSDHIEARVDAFQSFLLAVSFPEKLVDRALPDNPCTPDAPKDPVNSSCVWKLCDADGMMVCRDVTCCASGSCKALMAGRVE